MPLFDSHAHYDDEKFDNDRESMLEGLRQKNDVNPLGVSFIINAASNYNTSKISISLAKKYEHVYATCGIHPEFANDVGDELESELKSLLSQPKVVALGEIGLDYHYEDGAPKDIQANVFRRQLAVAQSLNKKVIVHDREAHADCLSIIKEFDVIGVFHSFSGSYEMAKELVKLGWYISFSGTVTFKNAVNVARSVLAVPDDRLLIETDAPYLAPVPYRGKVNNSAFMYETAKKIAEIRETSVEKIADITLNNGKTFFGIN